MTRTEFDNVFRLFFEAVADAVAGSPLSLKWLTSTALAMGSFRYADQVYADMACFLGYLPAPCRVLDFGTGAGTSAVAFAAAGHDVEGVDIDDFMKDVPTHRDMAAEQREIWPRLEHRFLRLHLRHYRGDLPYEPAVFDAICAYGVIEHIADPALGHVLGELWRVLKPGGLLMVSYLPRKWALCEFLARSAGIGAHDRLWGDHEAERFLRGGGFHVLRMDRIAFAPQHPPRLCNRWKRVLDAADRLAEVTPLAAFAHHLRIVARRAPPPAAQSVP